MVGTLFSALRYYHFLLFKQISLSLKLRLKNKPIGIDLLQLNHKDKDTHFLPKNHFQKNY